MKLYQLITILLICAVYHASAQDHFCGLRNTSFGEGEKLTFRVYYNMGFIWANAGTATFAVMPDYFNGRKVYHIVGEGRTNKSYEWFYKVRDRYETFLDAETLLPLKFMRNVHEGDIKFFNQVFFDHDAHTANNGKTNFTIPDCTQDVLSAIYYARNIDYNRYSVGSKIPFTMFLDDEVYHLYIRYLGKEKIKTKYGKFHAIKISPLLIKGTMFSGGEKMTVWVSDDANHVPVRIESPIVVGSIKVDLIGFERLRNPFNGLIKLND